MKRKEIISLAAKTACDALKFTPGPSRMHVNVQKRMAIAMALKKYCTHDEVGEQLDRDRSCIYHYMNKHDAHMDYWDGYKEYYNQADLVVTDILGDYDIKQKVSQLNDQITELIKARDEIKGRLEKVTV